MGLEAPAESLESLGEFDIPDGAGVEDSAGASDSNPVRGAGILGGAGESPPSGALAAPERTFNPCQGMTRTTRKTTKSSPKVSATAWVRIPLDGATRPEATGVQVPWSVEDSMA